MDKMAFAKLVQFIRGRSSGDLDDYGLKELDELVQVAAPATLVDREFMQRMFCNILGDKKIDAIKDYRQLTGCGLKESKDDIELLHNRIWPRNADKT